MSMTYLQFKKKYNGKYIDFDGHYGPQCTDLYRQYCKEVLNIPQSPLVEGAADIWNTYLKEYFERITNTPTGLPEQGDILIWNKNVGGGYGHVAIFDNGTTGKFQSFDQNWPTGSLCHVQGHYYTNLLGWLKFKNANVPYKKELEACLAQHTDLIEQLTEKDKIIKKIEGKKEEYRRDFEKEKAERESYDKFIQRLSQKLGSQCPAKMQDIEGHIQELIEKEDGETIAKKELELYEIKVSEELEKLAGIVGSLPQFPALLVASQGFKVRIKEQETEIQTLKEDVQKKLELVERYKKIIDDKEFTLSELLKMIIDKLFKGRR